jgi:hypothetical protein
MISPLAKCKFSLLQVTLTLPTFARTNGDDDRLPILPAAAAALWKVSWREKQSALVLTALGPVMGSAEACILTASLPGISGDCTLWTGVDVTVPAEAGLKLPTDGLQSNSEMLLLGTNARAGIVLPSPVLKSPAISAAKVPRASFRPRIAGSVVNTTLVLNTPVILLPGDSLIVRFPGFKLATSTIQIIVPADTDRTVWNVTAHLVQPNSTVAVILTLIQFSERNEFSLTIPATFGLTLPIGGISESSGLSISYAAAAVSDSTAEVAFSQVCACLFLSIVLNFLCLSEFLCSHLIYFNLLLSHSLSLPSTMILQVDLVGSFGTYTSLQFFGVGGSQAVAGQLADIAFEFNPTLGIGAGDGVQIYLPGFGGRAVSGAKVMSQPAEYFSVCDWSPETNTLTFYAATDIPGGSPISVVAPAQTAGIVLPADGVESRAAGESPANYEAGPTFSTKTDQGPIDPTPVAIVQGVGALGSVTLALACAPSDCAGNENVTISFSSSNSLYPGDHVVIGGDAILLPSAAGPYDHPHVMTVPAGKFLEAAEWRESAEGGCGWELVLTVASNPVSAGPQPGRTSVTIYPIRVPLAGISGSAALYFRLDSLYAPAAAVPVHILTNVPPVLTGRILHVSSQTSLVGGSAVNLVVEASTTATLDLSLNPSIVLGLPGFGPDSAFSIRSQPDGCGADRPTRGCKFHFSGAIVSDASEYIPALGGFTAAAWDPESQRLTLSGAVSPFHTGTRIFINVSSDVGLTLPYDGLPDEGGSPSVALVVEGREDDLREFDEIFVYSEAGVDPNSNNGLIPPLVTEARVLFDPAIPGESAVSMYITLATIVSLPPGTEIRFYLLGLAVPPGGVNVRSVQITPVASGAKAIWDYSGGLLVVTLSKSGRGLRPNEKLSVILPSTIGIGLPVDGLVGDVDGPSYEITFASDSGGTARNSTMKSWPRNPLEVVTAMGVFLELSADYEPRIPTLPAAISITIAVSVPLSIGDDLIVRLQDFWRIGGNQSNLTALIQVGELESAILHNFEKH